ncbi:MAG: right-handed parallel beta-helix repeat-containing protein, partial [Promethearchaeota archaeon]
MLKISKIRNNNNRKLFLTLGIMLAIMTINGVILNSNTIQNDPNARNENELSYRTYIPIASESYTYEEGPIEINATATTNTTNTGNWTWAVNTFDWCTGNGNWGTPYIIEDVYFNGGVSNHGLSIFNSQYEYFEIKNCKSNMSTASSKAGIYIKSTSNGSLVNNNISLNYVGIYLFDNCYNNTILGNNIVGTTEGIYLHDNCDDNTILGNNASYNEYGIFLDENCDNNTIYQNNASYSEGGIYLDDNCDDNTILGNNASYNDNGILIQDDCDNNKIYQNNMSYNDYGIYLEDDSDYNTIYQNNASYNTEYGIDVEEYCDYNTIYQNNASYNDRGIYLTYESFNNTISGNTATNNNYGLYLYYYCINTTIAGNNISYNDQNGITITDFGKNNTVSGNNVLYNGFYGIILNNQCDNNTVLNNTVLNNFYGIFVDNSTRNTILSNDASYNNMGIYLHINCTYTTIAGNNASYNGFGIYFDHDSDDNTIWMNYFSNNSWSQANTTDSDSDWDNGTLGNYWGDFEEIYPDAESSNGIWWDWEYEINSTSSYNDTRPLVHPGIPEITPSGNVDYLVGATGNEILWTLSDSTILDPDYWIYLDGEEIDTGSWSSGSLVSIDVDGFSVGTYAYLFVCSDGTAWGRSESQIIVNVGIIPKPDIINTDQTISTKSISVEWSEVTDVDSYRVYVNGSLTNNTDTLEQNIWLNETGTYSITVTAINGAEESEHSNPLIITVVLTPTITTSSQTIYTKNITIEWPEVVGVDSY